MARVIELKRGEQPRKFERYAMVLVSARPPRDDLPRSLQGDDRTFYAHSDRMDVASVISRAQTWAEENIIARVYVRRHGPAS